MVIVSGNILMTSESTASAWNAPTAFLRAQRGIRSERAERASRLARRADGGDAESEGWRGSKVKSPTRANCAAPMADTSTFNVSVAVE
jgi:hypothetical protein